MMDAPYVPNSLGNRERVYWAIVRFKIENDGLSSSYREIGDRIDLAHSGVFRYVRQLERMGRLHVTERGIMVTGGQWAAPGHAPETSESGGEREQDHVERTLHANLRHKERQIERLQEQLDRVLGARW